MTYQADRLDPNGEITSINQLAIEVKILETWKALNVEGYPTTMYPMKSDSQNANSDRVLRESFIRVLKDNAKTEIGERSFYISAAKIWNNLPKDIKCAKTWYHFESKHFLLDLIIYFVIKFRD